MKSLLLVRREKSFKLFPALLPNVFLEESSYFSQTPDLPVAEDLAGVRPSGGYESAIIGLFTVSMMINGLSMNQSSGTEVRLIDSSYSDCAAVCPEYVIRVV